MENQFRNSDFKKDLYYRKPCFKRQLFTARSHSYQTYVNTVRKLNNLRQARFERGDVRIRDILDLTWPDFKKAHLASLTRRGVIEAVEDSMSCGTFDRGFLWYECPRCGDVHMQGFTCKSRFCVSCGKKYRDARCLEISEKLVDAPHRHFVFSVPFQLRDLMRRYRDDMLDILFGAVRFTLERMLWKSSKRKYRTQKRMTGFISFLHTYGRGMNWNPHIHALVAERYMRSDGVLAPIGFFPFKALRMTFMFRLLSSMGRYLRAKGRKKDRTGFRILESEVRKRYPEGYYVYGPQLKSHSMKDCRAVAKYVARYAGHPAISEGRITGFDRDARQVSWFYDPHEDDNVIEEEKKIGRQSITEPADDFIKRLLIHIPTKGFQQIRYNGFYANKAKRKPKACGRLASDSELGEMRMLLRWEHSLMGTYGYTPLICDCGARMVLNPSMSWFGEDSS